jgi:predicted TIM-barrel fold metal-dependent hydrolase
MRRDNMARDVLLIDDFRPISQLVVPERPIQRAKFPVVDAHNHLPVWHERALEVRWGDIVAGMDRVNVQTVVNLSGGTGERLQQCLDKLDNAYPGRFATFCNVDWEGVGQPGWAEKAVEQLARDVEAGAKGLKVFKRLGLRAKDTDGKLLMPDDERLALVWDRVGQLGVPVLIHVADPVAFFQPLDRFNERWDEMHEVPAWSFYGPEFPTFETLIESLFNLIGRHRDTDFITAHVGCYPENLGLVSQMMDEHPNFYTDISARIAELGRAPYSAREWFIKYQDRILFGTDVRPIPEWYRIYFRFLETKDEYFNYSPGEMPGQGRWRIYGVHLPDEVLEKVYYRNAERLIR